MRERIDRALESVKREKSQGSRELNRLLPWELNMSIVGVCHNINRTVYENQSNCGVLLV